MSKLPLTTQLSYSSPNLPVYLFSLPLFFILTAETVIGFVFPIEFIRAGASNTQLGITLTLAALVALGLDFALPMIGKKKHWQSFLLSGIALAAAVIPLMMVGVKHSLLPLLVAAAICWYFFYELVLISQQQLIDTIDDVGSYTKDWSILFLITQISWIIGPIIAGMSLQFETDVLYSVLGVLIAAAGVSGLSVSLALPKVRLTTRPNWHVAAELTQEMSVFRKLAPRLITPLLIVFLINFMQEMFWNLGGLLGETTAHLPSMSWLVVNFYSIPLIVGPLVLTRFRMSSKKRNLALLSCLLGGLALVGLGLTSLFLLQLAVIFVSGLASSWAEPLNEAHLSKVVHAAGANKRHVMSLIRITCSISFLISPLITGWMADLFGYQMTFAYVGVATVLICAAAFIFQRKKFV